MIAYLQTNYIIGQLNSVLISLKVAALLIYFFIN